MTLDALFSVLAAVLWSGLLSLLVRVTLITAIGACVCALLRNASAATRHFTAMTTLAVLIGLPVAWALLPTVSLPILPPKAPPASVRIHPIPTGDGGGSSVVVPHEPVGNAAVPSTAPSLSGTRVLELAILVGAIATLLLLLHFVFSLAAAWLTVRRAQRILDPALRSDLDDARARLGVSRAVDLRESADVAGPVIWGISHPVLLLPIGARGWSREQLRIVFLHEVAHVARHDGVGLLLARIATSLFWFHPLVWVLARIARRECERSCDDLVLAVGERPTDYAERLLAVVRSMTRPDPFAGVAPALARRSNLESRLVSILRSNQRRGAVSRAGLVATLASGALVLVATAVVHVVAADPGRLVDHDELAAARGDWGPAVSVIQDQQPVESPSPEQVAKGEHRFRAGERAFREGSYVGAASSYLTAAATGYRFPESVYRAAEALAKAGAHDDAMRTLEVALQAGFDGEGVAADPAFEGLREDPRFVALLTPPAETPAEPAVPAVPGTPPVDPTSMAAAAAAAAQYQVAWSSLAKNVENSNNGIALMRAGQYDRAIQAFEGEVRENGSSNAMYNIACAYALRGDKRRAFDSLERAIENGFDDGHHMMEDDDLQSLQGDPHFYQLVRLAKDLQLMSGFQFGINGKTDWSAALPRFERVTREHPSIGRAWANLGYARLESGDAKGGAQAYQRALELGYRGPTIMYNLACCAARYGDADNAFRWLDRAEKAGFEVGEHIGTDSDLDGIRNDPRYDQLLQRWDENMAKHHREKKDKDKDDDEKTY